MFFCYIFGAGGLDIPDSSRASVMMRCNSRRRLLATGEDATTLAIRQASRAAVRLQGVGGKAR